MESKLTQIGAKKEIVELVIEFCRSRLDPFNRSARSLYSHREIEIYKKVASK
jgi:hypothetical protein